MSANSKKKSSRPRRHDNYTDNIPLNYLDKDPPSLVKLRVDYIEDILNHGLFTEKDIEKNEFVINYRGELSNEMPDGPDTYVYEYQWKGNTYFIDAREETSGLGRYINDVDRYHRANCKTVVTELPDDRTVISFYALADISAGEFYT